MFNFLRNGLNKLILQRSLLIYLGLKQTAIYEKNEELFHYSSSVSGNIPVCSKQKDCRQDRRQKQRTHLWCIRRSEGNKRWR